MRRRGFRSALWELESSGRSWPSSVKDLSFRRNYKYGDATRFRALGEKEEEGNRKGVQKGNGDSRGLPGVVVLTGSPLSPSPLYWPRRKSERPHFLGFPAVRPAALPLWAEGRMQGSLVKTELKGLSVEARVVKFRSTRKGGGWKGFQ